MKTGCVVQSIYLLLFLRIVNIVQYNVHSDAESSKQLIFYANTLVEM